ncbi:MAG: purine-nucleoside phosphorylase [Terriglobia bacterium]|jgi:purine-nucleoside phosphorylase
MPKLPGYDEAQRAARFLASRWRERPRVGIILGSGLGDVVSQVRDVRKIPYKAIPFFPKPSVEGHSGVLHLGRWGSTPVALMEGRMHFYEGYAPAEVVFPTRVLILAGVKTLLLTCAAGGIAPQAAPGSFMIFSDHLGYQGTNPLAGAHDPRWGQRFVDFSHAYDPELKKKARTAARALGLKCFEGVYVALLGPNYETPAEIRALARLGASAVGMSTVPEVMAARQMGARVLAIATISNRAAGLSRQPLSHQEVLQVGKQAAKNLARLFDVILPGL